MVNGEPTSDIIGSIKLLRLLAFDDGFAPPNFSCFGEIETVAIEFRDGKLRLRHGPPWRRALVTEINAKVLSIELPVYAWKSGSDDDSWQAKFELARKNLFHQI